MNEADVGGDDDVSDDDVGEDDASDGDVGDDKIGPFHFLIQIY